MGDVIIASGLDGQQIALPEEVFWKVPFFHHLIQASLQLDEDAALTEEDIAPFRREVKEATDDHPLVIPGFTGKVLAMFRELYYDRELGGAQEEERLIEAATFDELLRFYNLLLYMDVDQPWTEPFLDMLVKRIKEQVAELRGADLAELAAAIEDNVGKEAVEYLLTQFSTHIAAEVLYTIPFAVREWSCDLDALTDRRKHVWRAGVDELDLKTLGFSPSARFFITDNGIGSIDDDYAINPVNEVIHAPRGTVLGTPIGCGKRFTLLKAGFVIGVADWDGSNRSLVRLNQERPLKILPLLPREKESFVGSYNYRTIFAPDGDHYAEIYESNTVSIYSLVSEQELHRIPFEARSDDLIIRWSPDSSNVLVGDRNYYMIINLPTTTYNIHSMADGVMEGGITLTDSCLIYITNNGQVVALPLWFVMTQSTHDPSQHLLGGVVSEDDMSVIGGRGDRLLISTSQGSSVYQLGFELDSLQTVLEELAMVPMAEPAILPNFTPLPVRRPLDELTMAPRPVLPTARAQVPLPAYLVPRTLNQPAAAPQTLPVTTIQPAPTGRPVVPPPAGTRPQSIQPVLPPTVRPPPILQSSLPPPTVQPVLPPATVRPPLPQPTRLPPPTVQPALPPPTFQPVLPPPTVQPVLPPPTVQPVLPPPTVQPVLPPATVRPPLPQPTRLPAPTVQPALPPPTFPRLPPPSGRR